MHSKRTQDAYHRVSRGHPLPSASALQPSTAPGHPPVSLPPPLLHLAPYGGRRPQLWQAEGDGHRALGLGEGGVPGLQVHPATGRCAAVTWLTEVKYRLCCSVKYCCEE